MKLVFVSPLVVFLSALLGYGMLRLTGWQPHSREMFAAAIPNLLAGAAAVLPALWQRPGGQAAVVQGAFQGMIVHMGVTLALAVMAFVLAGPHGLDIRPFALWLVWFFFGTLTAVSASLIRVIHSTPIAGANVQNL